MYTAPSLVARTSAFVPRLPRHPEIVPSSVTKRKMSPAKVPPENTWPLTPSPGTATTKSSLVIVLFVTEYKVATPVPLSLTQNGLEALNDIPQGFTRFGSSITARPGTCPLYTSDAAD